MSKGGQLYTKVGKHYKHSNLHSTFMTKPVITKLKYISFLVIFTSTISCEAEEQGCEFETVCYGDNNCIEKPIPGTCF